MASTEYNRAYYLKNKEKLKIKKEQWRQANRERVKATAQNSFYKRVYGITLAQVEEMRRLAGSCEICGSDPGGRWDTLNLDHNHETGKIRGVLCTDCNHGLGKFKDDQTLLDKAAEYLRRHQEG